MSVESTEALERSVLESKDREQLLAIAGALGVKATSRAKKADIIAKILEQTGAAGGGDGPQPKGRARNGNANGNGRTSTRAAAASTRTAEPEADGAIPAPAAEPVAAPPADDNEPPAEWELALGEVTAEEDGSRAAAGAPTETAEAVATEIQSRPGPSGPGGQGEQGDGTGQGSRRRRRRNRDRNRGEGPQGADRFDNQPQTQPTQEAFQGEPVAVAGYLDLRDEGYGFLRVNGYLASRDDVYVSVKQTRQYGLRKGDHVTGLSRPAGRNEKNPALLRIDTVNGGDPEQARNRPKFEDLTPLFPDEKFRLENGADPTNMTARIIDLIAPIGKGQRGLIVSPPKAGKTFVMKTIATSIEHNNPEVRLIVLLVDERPEEVTDMRRHVVRGEVVASTFDRPSDEHTSVAELTIERAKRLVEMGTDVVIVLDGITRLARAYNLSAPASGRIMSGGVDSTALYPPKKFFGAARNIEEGGSLTIIATALIDTGSKMDTVIFEEFKGTGNLEIVLDRQLVDKRIWPAIDINASGTRREEMLLDPEEYRRICLLRRVLAERSATDAMELLVTRLQKTKSNAEFLMNMRS